jgi:hypothetical protein
VSPQDTADVVLDPLDEHPASIGPTASATAAPIPASRQGASRLPASRHRARATVRPSAVNSRTFRPPSPALDPSDPDSLQP